MSQSEKVVHKTDVQPWTCPHCSHWNTDMPLLTAVPYCAACERDVQWSDVLPGEHA